MAHHDSWRAERFACSCAKGHGDFTIAGAEPHYPPGLELEPVHVTLELTLAIERETLDGRVTHTLRSNGANARDIALDAVNFANVEVTCARDLTWHYDGKRLVVRFESAVPRGETCELTVSYTVAEPVAGLYFSNPDPQDPDRTRYAATDNETERARHWFPTIDLPAVRPTLRFELTSAAEDEALANGAFVERRDNGNGTATTVWALDARCPSYLTCIAVGDFTRLDDESLGELPISYFAASTFEEEHLRRAFGRTRDMLEWMQRHLDMPFPFPKYFQFALPGFGGAMENISLVSWDDFALLDETQARDLTWLVDQVNAHEMAHSYFGDLVVCRDFSHAWLKESWATYMETCWLEHRYGRDEADYDFFANCRRYFEEADGRYMRPIMTRTFNSSWDMYDMHLYPGGGARLHMLRKELGDDVFWDGVQRYLKNHAHDVVETDDFRRALEQASGRSLVRWFDQWIYSRGYPHLGVEFGWDDDAEQGTFTVTQKQVAPKKDTSLPTFGFELELGWMIDGELHTCTFDVSRARHEFVVAMPTRPSHVRVDPNARAVIKLDFSPGRPMLEDQLKHAGDVVGRIRAIEGLVENGSATAFAAVRDGLDREAFWGVTVHAMRALAKAGTDRAIALVAERVRAESNDMALVAVMDAAGSQRDGRIRDALVARLDVGDLSYRSRAAALEALGKQREDAPVDMLERALRTPTFRSTVERGAALGLAETRAERALDVLLDALGDRELSFRIKPSIATAVGRMLPVLERRARERAIEGLTQSLAARDERLRMAAMKALTAANVTEATDHLESVAATWAAQDRITVEHRLAAMRKRADARGKEASDERLRERLASLEKRVAELAGALERVESEGA